MRVGDAYVPHACVVGHSGPHGRALAEGSATVYVNGRKAGRKGDAIDCGGEAQTASSNVFIGDQGADGKIGGAAGCQKDMAGQSMPFVKG